MKKNRFLQVTLIIAVVALAMAGCATNGGGTVTNAPVVTDITWTEVKPFGVPDSPNDDNIFWHVAYGGGKFLATRNNDARLVYSTDGVTWAAVADSPFSRGRGVIAYGGGKWVAVRGTTSYSADGLTWTQSANDELWANAIAYGGGKFVAVADWASIFLSADGITWTKETNWAMDHFKAIAYGGGKFVAAGVDGIDGGAEIAYSTDGVDWTSVSEYTQLDSETWTKEDKTTFGETKILDIAYGNGKFVAVGDDGKMAYSADGITWTAIEQGIFGAGDPIRAIAYGGGKFVAASAWNKMAYSTDGITWTEIKDGPTSNRGIFDIAYGNDRFVIVLGEDKIAYSNRQ